MIEMGEDPERRVGSAGGGMSFRRTDLRGGESALVVSVSVGKNQEALRICEGGGGDSSCSTDSINILSGDALWLEREGEGVAIIMIELSGSGDGCILPFIGDECVRSKAKTSSSSSSCQDKSIPPFICGDWLSEIRFGDSKGCSKSVSVDRVSQHSTK